VRVRFCFDFVSPYAYIAWTQIHKVCEGHEVERWPVLFAALLDAHGTVGPAEVPAKRAYIFKDAFRTAHKLHLPPLTPPPSHPFNPLAALRACTVATEKKKELIAALYAAAWASGAGIDSIERVAAVASSIGLDGAALAEKAQSQEAKDTRRAQTENAISQGIFAVPTAFCDGEIFWGVDALGHLRDRLDGRDPIQGASLERWASLPASARRKKG